jgi:hypothetical protein
MESQPQGDLSLADDSIKASISIPQPTNEDVNMTTGNSTGAAVHAGQLPTESLSEQPEVDMAGQPSYGMGTLSPRPRSAKKEANKPAVSHETAHALELYRIHSATFELKEGDTLVFIDFPDPPFNTKHVDCDRFAFKSQSFRMSSKKLLGTGSSKFADLLGPTYQYRIKRRRKLVNTLPEGVKYVIDMSPPSEGDDLVFQMTELSLPPGIIKWWQASQLHAVDESVVGGHDDVCTCWEDKHKYAPPSPTREEPAKTDDEGTKQIEAPVDEINEGNINFRERSQLERALRESVELMGLQNDGPFLGNATAKRAGAAARLMRKKEKGDLSVAEIPSYRKIPEYCPIRHRVNILRLFMLIAGKDVMVDSAPRVWTLVGIAKIFDCQEVVVSLPRCMQIYSANFLNSVIA